ncbi:MAG: AmmeMemoRadiSam system radical SAM enzyme, partial [Deltaproteobacteria bacterium]|nr:AmmeMemoRadiSam system radical SAM enzyme [Deltaproteobacteria bacterium]MBW2257797.1 AmmeMemoRadiSam system radical SAM enzyme [Deltaproteobacteria bacterium]
MGGTHPGRWWERASDGRIRCVLCPRACTLRPGQRGFCYVREATDDGMVLTTYGRSSGFCIDPIEKKPLNHFFPGSSILSFGTAGCNLGCRFCQNWDISKARKMDRLQSMATPEDIATVAKAQGCASVAFTYNDPVIFAEYAIDTAHVARQLGVQTVAVTAGYITEQARAEFYAAMDAANIDLKAFTEDFYRKQCFGHLGDVLETIAYAVNEA